MCVRVFVCARKRAAAGVSGGGMSLQAGPGCVVGAEAGEMAGKLFARDPPRCISMLCCATTSQSEATEGERRSFFVWLCS